MQIRNSITLIGNVGAQPKVFNTKDGQEYVRFSLATNDSYTNKQGVRIKNTEWHEIVVFGRQAETIKNMVEKGALLAVSGQLQYNKWTDKHNQQRKTARIKLDNFTFVGPKKEAEQAAA